MPNFKLVDLKILHVFQSQQPTEKSPLEHFATDIFLKKKFPGPKEINLWKTNMEYEKNDPKTK